MMDIKNNSGITMDPFLLVKKTPWLSAYRTVLPVQKAIIIFILIVIAVMLFIWPWLTLKFFVFISTLFYLVFSAYRLLLVGLSISRESIIDVSEEEIKFLDEDSLPVYSILVPLYKEPESVEQLINSLKALDYPHKKLDIQLLLEEDDIETINAVKRIKLPEFIKVTIVSVSIPRTKPKACNVGLAGARGEYLTIYDAEDKPEPDQLKKAVVAFRKSDPEIICLQCKLNFYNSRQNLLTRMFTAEYSTWFDLSLPGLSALRSVIPLGGTSNHFITSKIRELCGWDPYNVTEDCDLGIRIYRAGYRTKMLNTTTWEEACSSVYYWIRQRTRWLKGYMQTYLVHMRSPLKLFCELGFLNFMNFHILIAGIVFSSLINPVYWLLALMWFVFRVKFLTFLFPGAVFAMGAVCLFFGNFVFMYINCLSCYKRGNYDLIKYTLLMPFYWVLMSYSGWRAFVHLLSKPFEWEKTQHGLHFSYLEEFRNLES